MKTVEQRLADLETAVFNKQGQMLPQVPILKVMPEIPWDEWCAQLCACGHPRQEHTGKSADGSCNGAGCPCGCESFDHAPMCVHLIDQPAGSFCLLCHTANFETAGGEMEPKPLIGRTEEWNRLHNEVSEGIRQRDELLKALATRDAEIRRLREQLGSPCSDCGSTDVKGLCMPCFSRVQEPKLDAFAVTIARMRPVVEAAVEWWADTPQAVPILLEAVKIYQQQKSHKG